jgi:membrane protein involved in colicin uptake
MVTKIQDGQRIYASEVLSGALDAEGNTIKFQQVEGTNPPTYRATSDMNDGTGRTRVYTFSLGDTLVTVNESIVTQEQMQAQRRAQQIRQQEEQKQIEEGRKFQEAQDKVRRSQQEKQQTKEEQQKATAVIEENEESTSATRRGRSK